MSLILTTVAAVAGLALYAKTQSALCLMFGLENLVDFASSAIVLWRFYCPGELTKAREEFLMKREERASIGISFILLVLGIFVISAALDDLVGGAETQSDLKIVKVGRKRRCPAHVVAPEILTYFFRFIRSSHL